MPTYDIDLDIKSGSNVPQAIRARVGDHLTRTLSATINDGGEPYDLNGCTARFECVRPDRTMTRSAAEIKSGKVVYSLTHDDLSCAGDIMAAYFAIVKGDAVVTTESIVIHVADNAESGSVGVGKSYSSEIEEMLAELSDQKAAYDKAESERATAETARATSESARATAEGIRKSNETARVNAETARETAEGKRATAETSRTTEEGKRATAETSRATEEGKRATAEGTRKSNETARQTAERARAAAETDRETAQAKNNADQALNNAAMAKLSPYICAPGEYDAGTLVPTVDGEPNRTYYVPAEQGPNNRYVEWMLIEGAWEMMGVSNVEITAVTTAQIDQVAADQAPTGEDTLNLTGLSYLWAKIKAAFAPRSHASSATTHGAASASLYGHAKASQTAPKANGTAALGSETAMFARGDHVHPLQQSVSGNAGTATKLATARSIALAGDLSGSANFDGSANVSITAAIKALAVKTAMIADSAITAAKIANLTITASKIANGAIGTTQLADSSVTSAKIANGTISTADLADLVITNAKLGNGSVSAAKLEAALLKRITDLETFRDSVSRVLWSGEWSDGSITVPGLDGYTVFGVRNASSTEWMLGVSPKGSTSFRAGLDSISKTPNVFASALQASRDGERLTMIACGYANVLGAAVYPITVGEIVGIM